MQEVVKTETPAVPSELALLDLNWWFLNYKNKSPIWPAPASHYIITDASGTGWRAYVDERHLQGLWTQKEQTLHANLKELLVIYLVIKKMAFLFKHQTVSIQSDNCTALAYLRNQGGTRSIKLMELTRQIFEILSANKIHVITNYIPGPLNGIADSLSRGKSPPEWFLLPQACEKIFSKWGVPAIDLFASEQAHVVQTYVSRDLRDKQAAFTDAFSKTWNFQMAWVFPPPSNAQSTGLAESSTGHLHSDLPQVEQRLLEIRSKSSSSKSSIHNFEPEKLPDRHQDEEPSTSSRFVGVGGMVNSGWDDLLRNWSPQQRELIESSWRPSTLKTYKSAWEKWSSWCASNNINTKNPGGDGLAKYLIFLHQTSGLSYKTILVHKTVVSNFCQPDAESKIGNHVLVRQALRGIANKSCKNNRLPRVPVWNPQVVVDWLLENDPDQTSLFDVSQRCAILLLLASGRRIHDLTLLSTAPENFLIRDDQIILWPLFGSKTDSLSHKQSGWQLTSGLQTNIDPVFWIKKLIEVSTSRRGNLDSLFITTIGESKPASRTVIGGWIRTILKSAGIQASPGSIRSAVASLSWLDQTPVQDILERGNWLSSNTLLRHYARPIAQSNLDVPSVATSFCPIRN
ncbi:hypothetical protein O0L34_g5683 [Tuta absoluta]|nr:hypothetical protein O0L34_g5683 [Tuta absoluta]